MSELTCSKQDPHQDTTVPQLAMCALQGTPLSDAELELAGRLWTAPAAVNGPVSSAHAPVLDMPQLAITSPLLDSRSASTGSCAS